MIIFAKLTGGSFGALAADGDPLSLWLAHSTAETKIVVTPAAAKTLFFIIPPRIAR